MVYRYSIYWYPCREVVLDGSHNYKEDLYGNEYVGENYSIKISLSNGGKVFLGDKCNFNDHVFIFANHMSELRIESEVVLLSSAFIYSGYSSVININKKFSSSSNLYIVAMQNSKVLIGEDCMLSNNIVIRAGNSHNIFDLENKENIIKRGYNVVIGDHVWIGQQATLFNGCEIGSGSIVGINSFVNKKFPSNCSIAGNPARIIKENVAWRRESYPYFDSYEDFAEFDFR